MICDDGLLSLKLLTTNMMMMVQGSVQGCFVQSLLVVTSLTSASGTLKQFFIREPDNQTAIEGEQVTSSHSTFQRDSKF